MDSIEIVLKKDNNNRDIDLDNMPIGATESLKNILESLIEIARYEKTINNIDLNIGVKSGSACEMLIGTPDNLKVVYNKIEDVVNNKPSRDNFYVKNLNIIRNNIHEKKDAKIFYLKDNSRTEITNLFDKSFKEKREKDKTLNYFEVEFIKGKLLQNGGTNPNFHLQIPAGIITIDCTEEEAQKVNYLYQEIYISAWVDKKKKGKRVYRFCDFYMTDSAKQHFIDFEKFFKEISTLKGTEPLHRISSKLESFYNIKDFENASKFLRIFNNKEVNPNYLKTILVLSKNIDKNIDSVKNKIFVDTLKNLNQLLNKKIRK
ncbi:hypothetical protein [Flavobacterium johnsoniae]|uniref:Uncharacterized protein n=1 Tax=Flavobacterium johnsoniae (strain ATCC 17061 / DSM 2064 / JCM 8514 / BCRC 14874 / CCUG 350202 / NBRC 14942 / NCIMB 11054 / UW101) TaxID=376686 RepID=A5FM81_FLAJ1|nr:hypothetical protein [Flavobacterium johnsoniae]ABQ03692.1 hypothetical protein Fjoh_0657 [Flavobacterium johnsoniae UW101]OXG03216.1 hypothetical protein B0A63_00130 [Flavobacterium johnsoniae UW101]WQG79446.1 hypothetical protein SR927_15595 [Flavobacterium johnsoniae UW101]SHJ99936.1 hypothetical protein SAMN05444146_0055 [Flavobacterium johnsoniae]